MTRIKRPTAERFYEGLAEFIEDYHSDIAFDGYGSFFNHPNNPAIRDLDGVIVMPTLITDKKSVQDISRRIAELSSETGIGTESLELNLLDAESAKDGRFLSYSTDYIVFLAKYGKHLTGQEIDFKRIDNRFSTFESPAFNLRGIRNAFLMAVPKIGDNAFFNKNLIRLYGDLEKMPRRVLGWLIYRENEGYGRYEIHADMLYKKSKGDCFAEMPRLLDIDPKQIRDAMERIEKAESTNANLIDVWFQALGVYELMLKRFIDRYPPRKVSVTTLI